MFESYISRLRFAQPAKVQNSHRCAMEAVLADYPTLQHWRALADVYIVQDTLMHAHLWEIDYENGVARSSGNEYAR